MDQIFALGEKKYVREVGSFVDLESQKQDGFTLLEAKSMLFLSQIFHLLLPQNSPQPIRVKKTKDGNYSVAYEKIPHDPLHAEVNKHRMGLHTFWKEKRGRAVSVKDPEFIQMREETQKVRDKLQTVENDPKYQELLDRIKECGFGNLYELDPINVIRDEKNGEYIFIDPEPAIVKRQERGPLWMLGIPKKVTQLRISLDNIEKVIDQKLTGHSRTMAMQYLKKLRELLPKKYKGVFEKREDRVIKL